MLDVYLPICQNALYLSFVCAMSDMYLPMCLKTTNLQTTNAHANNYHPPYNAHHAPVSELLT